MAVKLTNRADANIIDIYLQTARTFGRHQAETYYAGLNATFGRLVAQPYLARERAEFTPPVRILPYEAHLIVYLVEGADVLVVRILHERQDVERHL